MGKRYELKEILGRGGMGAVYRAYDAETRRDVTLKTLLDVQDRAMLELFYRECQVLASLNHPNIVDIYDVGEMEFDGGKRPYFVMPLLTGQTLDQLIQSASHRLNPGAVVDMLAQAARGLHAAHERGLVHRDIKPSNIFVMDDDSVKIIDFGVAHLADARTSTTLKGTLHYMAPEQLQMQKPTPLSDLFSLAVVSYQAFALRRPFEGASTDETVQAILHRLPPPLFELNPAVNRGISQVVHKAMAKQPYHRFANLREFGDSLHRALRGDAIDLFDDTKILPKLERARRAADAEEFDFANEVLAGLEAEGFLHPEMGGLRRRVDDAIRARTIQQRLGTARRFLAEEEYQLALGKVQELLDIDPGNTQASALRTEIEFKRGAEQVSRWLHLAEQHAANHAYSHARQAVENVLQLRPDDPAARRLMASIREREQDYQRLRREKDAGFRSAREAWNRGDVSIAMGEMERVLELDGRAPETSAAGQFEKFYNEVRSEHDTLMAAYERARGLFRERDFAGARTICEQTLEKYPAHALFQALKVDIEQQVRQDQSAFVARVDAQVDQEPDLDRRIALLRDALVNRPGEAHFQRALVAAEAKRDLVQGIVTRARAYEQNGQWQEAVSQFEVLRSIYPAYPALELELERMGKQRLEQLRTGSHREWVTRVDQALALGRGAEALELLANAAGEFPGDAELAALEQVARQTVARAEQAVALVASGRASVESGKVDAGLDELRQARKLDEKNPAIRASIVEILVRRARALIDKDWIQAERLAQAAAEIEPGNPMARSLLSLVEDRRRMEFIEGCVVEARQFQASADMDQAMTTLSRGLAEYPSDQRLLQLRVALEQTQTAVLRASGPDPVTMRPASGPALPQGPPVEEETMLAIPAPPARPAPKAAAPPPPKPPVTAKQPPVVAAKKPPLAVPPPATQPAAPKGRSKWPLAAAAVAVIALATVGYLRFSTTTAPPPAAVEPPAKTDATPAPVEPPTTPPPAEAPADATKPAAAATTGTLALTVNDTNFTLLINGQAAANLRPGGSPGLFVLAGLNPGAAKLTLQKQGLRSEPEQLLVNIVAGQTARVQMKLVSPDAGRWVLRGARPGTQIHSTQDGRLLGTADAQGNASGSDVAAGPHDVELRLKGYHRRAGYRVTIRQGQESPILGPDPQLERIEVLLQLQSVEPHGATTAMSIEHTRFELKYDGPNPLRPLPAQIKLPPGTYNFTFSAPGHDSETINVELKDYPLSPTVKLRKK